MGELVRLDEWRSRRQRAVAPATLAIRRLEELVRRLDPAVSRVAAPDGTVDPRIQGHLLAITGAVSRGRTREAVRRAERLAVLLEHPSARRRS